jgi:hypothetical protein
MHVEQPLHLLCRPPQYSGNQWKSIIRFLFDYTIVSAVMTVVKLNLCTVVNQDPLLFCAMTIGIPKMNQEEIISRLIELRSLEMKKQD